MKYFLLNEKSLTQLDVIITIDIEKRYARKIFLIDWYNTILTNKDKDTEKIFLYFHSFFFTASYCSHIQ